MNPHEDGPAAPPARRSRLARALRVEWLGQTVASLCWIVSVFVYGISSGGDWLQLSAASSWLVANIAALVNAEAD
ncbi:MAG: hypothetical protein AAF772_14190 [Acidobacteriota bacterium]